jgi:hypothetical protein
LNADYNIIQQSINALRLHIQQTTVIPPSNPEVFRPFRIMGLPKWKSQGNSDPHIFLQHFKVLSTGIPQEHLLMNFVSCFEGSDLTWISAQNISTFANLEQAFLQHYLPHNQEQLDRLAFLNCKYYPGESLCDYTLCFEELRSRIHSPPHLPEASERFIAGLPAVIQQKVTDKKLDLEYSGVPFPDVLAIQRFVSFLPYVPNPSPPTPVASVKPTSLPFSDRLLCNHCGYLGHVVSDCRSKGRNLPACTNLSAIRNAIQRNLPLLGIDSRKFRINRKLY